MGIIKFDSIVEYIEDDRCASFIGKPFSKELLTSLLSEIQEHKYTEAGRALYHPIYMDEQTELAFTKQNFSNEDNEVYTFVLHTYIALGGVRQDIDLITELPRIVNELSEKLGSIITFSPEVISYVCDSCSGFCVEVNSPLCVIPDGFDNYLATLTRKRRYKAKQALGQYEGLTTSIHTEINHNLAQEIKAASLDYMWHKRQYDDWAHGLNSILFANALLKQTESSLFYIVRNKEKTILAILSFYRIDCNGLLFHSIVINPHESTHNIGAVSLFSMIKELSDNKQSFGIEYIDPTCDTQPFNPDPVDIYKRVVVNKSRYLPLFLLTSSSFDDEHYEDENFSPPYYNEGAWVKEINRIDNFGELFYDKETQ